MLSDQARILQLLDNLIEDVGDMKVAIARLEERANAAAAAGKPGLVRDGGITVSGGAVGAALAFLAQHWVK